MMNETAARDLRELHRAANERNQEQLQYLTKKIFQQLDYYFGIAVVVEILHRWLPIFESYYPDEGWVRQTLLGVATFGTAPDDSVSEMALSQSFSMAGCGNYIKAIYDLTQAMQPKHTGEARIGYMTSALVNAVMAELAEAWYGDEPDLWEAVRQDPGSAENLEVAYLFWTDPETTQLDRQAWHDIAQILEKALAR